MVYPINIANEVRLRDVKFVATILYTSNFQRISREFALPISTIIIKFSKIYFHLALCKDPETRAKVRQTYLKFSKIVPYDIH